MPDQQQTTDPGRRFWQLAMTGPDKAQRMVHPDSDTPPAERAAAWHIVAEHLAELAKLAQQAHDNCLDRVVADQGDTFASEVASYAAAFRATFDRWQTDYQAAREQYVKDYRRNHGTTDGAEIAWQASHTRELMMSRQPQPVRAIDRA